MRLVCSDRYHYCDMEPPADLMSFFKRRGDKQITSLEILAIALGISTFGHMIANRRLIVFSDNKGAERSTQKGMLTLFSPMWAGIRSCPYVVCLGRRRSTV